MFISETINLPTKYGLAQMVSFGEREDFFLKFEGRSKIPYVRIHSECVSGDCLGSLLCDCGEQLYKSLELISEYGGYLFYLRQEGRGSGLHKKMRAIHLEQIENIDTVDAYGRLGLNIDERKYDIVAEILKSENTTVINLISNNPDKLDQLQNGGIKVNRILLDSTISKHNRGYLYAKKQKLNHSINHLEQKNTISFYQPYDENGRLANFSQDPIVVFDQEYQTVEHYYQSQKFKGKTIEKLIIEAETPAIAKQLSRDNDEHKLNNRESIKENIMWIGNVAKFEQHPKLLQKLLDTGDKVIVEDAPDDRYRGIGSDGLGKNRMGKILMDIRSYFNN